LGADLTLESFWADRNSVCDCGFDIPFFSRIFLRSLYQKKSEIEAPWITDRASKRSGPFDTFPGGAVFCSISSADDLTTIFRHLNVAMSFFFLDICL